MLNENKVKMMTKMAIYEKNEGKKMLHNARYYKGDYVALAALKSTITTTLAFIIIVIMIARIASINASNLSLSIFQHLFYVFWL